MRFLHTADWHLGKLFHGFPLTQDHRHVLGQVIRALEQLNCDALVIAGDIFDRSFPPVEALQIWEECLEEVAGRLGLAVLVIPGNHDHPLRLSHGSRLFSRSRIHLVGDRPEDVTLHDEHGPVTFRCLPYMAPSDMAAALAQPPPGRAVAVAHGFIYGGEESSSERPLFLGASERLGTGVFAPYAYGALGHLHRFQQVAPSAYYSGSLLAHSAPEASGSKHVLCVDLDARGEAAVAPIPLAPLTGVQCLTGTLEELLGGRPGSPRDYTYAFLTDTVPVYEPFARLQEVYPLLVQLERPSLRAAKEGAAAASPGVLPGDVFAEFYRQACGEEPSPQCWETFRRALAQAEAQT